MPNPRSKNRLTSIEVIRRLNLRNRGSRNHSIRGGAKQVIRLIESRNPRLRLTPVHPPADVNPIPPEVEVNPTPMVHNRHVVVRPHRVIDGDEHAPSLRSASLPLRRNDMPVGVDVDDVNHVVATEVPVLYVEESMR